MRWKELGITLLLCAVACWGADPANADSPVSPSPTVSASPAGETIYYQPYDGFQASRDAQLRWDARRIDAINRQLGWNELFRARAATARFDPWFDSPYVPYRPDAGWGGWPYAVGRIDGYGFYDAIRQPIGRRQVQTGPNRWESFPIYAEDVEKPVVPLSPPVVERSAPAAPVPPAASSPKGREF